MNKNIINCPSDPALKPDTRGLGVVFFEKMKEHGDKIAQVDVETEETTTFNQLLLQSIRVAQHMQAKGYTSDDIITLCTLNTVHSSLPILAALYLQIRICSVDPSLSVADSEHLLRLAKPRAIFCDMDSIDMVETALKNAGLKSEIIVFGEKDNYCSFSDFLRSTGYEDTFEVKPVDDLFKTAMIFFSSGTTGLPKGICGTHSGLLGEQLLLRDVNMSVILHYTSFYWISSVMLLIQNIVQGGLRLLCRKFEPLKTLQYIEKYKVTYGFMSPYIAFNVLEDPKLSSYDRSSLQCLTVSGGGVGKDQTLRLRKSFPHTVINFSYGMTETHGYVTYFCPIKHKALIETKGSSVGTVIPGISYKVVDPDTEEILGQNQSGELMVKGDWVMRGYHNNPEETAKVFDKDGFLHTGDIVYFDNDFCYFIVDRIKDLIKYQSWHVQPAELEMILLNHPEVREAAVVGKPHPIDGEHPVGVVVLRPGAKATEEEILSFCNEKVSERKKLRGGVKFIKNLPYTPTGKIKRRVLRELVKC